MAKRGSHKFDLKQFEPLQLLSQKTLPSDHGRFKHAYDLAMLKLPKYTHESKVYPSAHESKTSPCHLGCGSLTTHAHANTRTHTHTHTHTTFLFLAKRSEGHGSKNAVSVEQRNLT